MYNSRHATLYMRVKGADPDIKGKFPYESKREKPYILILTNQLSNI